MKENLKQGEGYTALASAIVVKACQDYMALLKRQKKSKDTATHDGELAKLEKFFKSDWCYYLCPEGFDDGNYLINALREKVDEDVEDTKDNTEQILKLYYDDLVTIREICRKFNMKEGQVRKILIASGKGLYGNVNTERVRRILTKEVLEDMYVKQGMSAEEISKELGVSGMTIFNRMRKFGISSRKQGKRRKKKNEK